MISTDAHLVRVQWRRRRRSKRTVITVHFTLIFLPFSRLKMSLDFSILLAQLLLSLELFPTLRFSFHFYWDPSLLHQPVSNIVL